MSGGKSLLPSAYGGPGWSPRLTSMRDEIGCLWGDCGVATEYGRLKTVLLHRPGREIEMLSTPDQMQMLEKVDVEKMCEQHDDLAAVYRDAEVEVLYVEPTELPPPNLMFVADLLFTTPEGVIVGRPASTVRAGEERIAAKRLADLGIPILRTIRGTATFEGADAAWIDPETVFIATGLRTNSEGANQVATLLEEMGIQVLKVELPPGTMHLMGTIRLVSRKLAIAWPGKVPTACVDYLRHRGCKTLFIPDATEAVHGAALNFVAIEAMKIVMPAGNQRTKKFYKNAGISCRTVEVGELRKAAGSIACITGVLRRD